jgi:hypothetical protein
VAISRPGDSFFRIDRHVGPGPPRDDKIVAQTAGRTAKHAEDWLVGTRHSFREKGVVTAPDLSPEQLQKLRDLGGALRSLRPGFFRTTPEAPPWNR